VIQTALDGTSLCLRASGAVAFSPDGAGIESVPAGGWVAIGTRSDGRDMELLVTPGASGPEQVWTVDGALRPLGTEGDTWRDATLSLLAGYWAAFESEERSSELRRELVAVRAQQEVDLNRLVIERINTTAPTVYIDGVMLNTRGDSVRVRLRDIEAARLTGTVELPDRPTSVADLLDRHRLELQAGQADMRRSLAELQAQLAQTNSRVSEREIDMPAELRRLLEAMRRIP
jgi:hypothetical protein